MRKNLTTEEFIEKAKKIHGNKYDYSEVDYIKSIIKVKIKCNICDTEFHQQPSNHLTGYGCQKCANIKTGSILKNNIEDFTNKANEIHNNYYDYTRSIYTKNNEKLEIICPIHGSFWQKSTHHINRKQGCPKCSKNVSKPEIEVQDFIKSLGFKIKTNDRNFLENGQELDIIIHSKKLAIEFNGTYWHYDKRNKNVKSKEFHTNKSKICKSKNYVLLHLREDLWNCKKEHMKNVIKKLLEV